MGYVRKRTPCYNLHVTDRGVAYQLWAAIEDERLTRGWSGVRMAEHLGLPRNTISRLKTSPRKADPATVHKVADGLRDLGVEVNGKRIDRKLAEQLAGLRPLAPSEGGGQVSVREAILADPNYNEQQRQTMLQLVDIIDQANQAQRGEERRAG